MVITRMLLDRNPSVGKKLLDVPFPEMIYKMASAIAESQFKLDVASIDILRIMGDKKNCPVYLPAVKVDNGGKVVDSEDADIVTSMIGAGFQPTFYQFVETMIEVQMTITVTADTTNETKTKGTSYNLLATPNSFSIRATPIDATYTSTYNFTQEGSSTLKTRLVPVPPNTFIQRLLEMKSQAMQNAFELQLKEIELAIENSRPA